ncbi:MAG: carboxypeptidase regulatory-like domain-containing protein [Sedimentisphaerales bacterium]|nr:carboxypeptidase regulatory-like domain-containing protein [Sedimentisphaerales bacterium]
MRRMHIICHLALLSVGTCFGRGITVTGKVVDYLARPVADAQVAVIENGRETETQLQDARLCGSIRRTDDRGLFLVEADIENVRDVYVVASKPGLAMAWDRAPIMAENADKVHFNLVMEKPASLTGLVVDSSGRPVARATVRAVPKTCYLSRLSQSPVSLPQEWLSTQTGADGRFEFNIFSADVSCDFWIRAEGYCCTYTFTTNYLSGCGYEVGRSDIRLVLPDERPVRGRVVEQGTDTTVADVELVISRPTDRNRRDEIKDRYLQYQVRSDANGCFVFPGVPAGDHEVGLVYPSQKLSSWVAEPIGVLVGPDHAADNVTFEVDRGGFVEILARHAHTREPLEGIVISMTNLSFSRLPRTDSNGVARIRLRPGQSRALISAGFSPNDEYRSWGRYDTREPFVIRGGETVRLEADLEPGYRIVGTVVDQNGKAVAGATVKSHPLGTGGSIIMTIGDEFRADAQGCFDLACGDADPSGWYVTAHCKDRDWVGIAPVTDSDQPVQIRVGQGVTVKGTVTNKDGVGVSAARVAVAGRLSGTVTNITTETLCNADGEFLISGVLAPDEATVYRLCVDASGYGPKSYVEIDVSDRPGTVTDLGRIELIAADQSLAGIAVDSEGRPVPNIPIFMHSSSREVSQPDKRAATDENGRFRFERICKGPIRLQADFRSSPLYGYASAEAGQQDVKILMVPGTQGTVVRSSTGAGVVTASPRYENLMGKQLNQIEGLKSLLPEDAADRPMLIIFMDQQQRPSRRAVMDLSERADRLEEKGFKVVAVQVATIERTDLDKWLAAENVPFEIQILKDDFNKRQYSWGVKSLPWLILTDKSHTVTAEGFGIGELESKISVALK